jgi:hypothetical protein
VWALWLDLAVKAALVGLLLFAVVRPDLPQFEGKAMVARAFLYPISALIVPVCSGFAEALGAEYFTSSGNSPELRTAYTDTLGNLALGLAGSTLAAALTVTALWPARVRPPASPADAR